MTTLQALRAIGLIMIGAAATPLLIETFLCLWFQAAFCWKTFLVALCLSPFVWFFLILHYGLKASAPGQELARS